MLFETLPVAEPLPKKLKHDYEETSPNSPEYDSDKEGFQHMNKQEIEEYREYMRQVNESNGFDIQLVPQRFRRVIGSFILPCKIDDPELEEPIQQCTNSAIDVYNKLMKGKSLLQLVDIKKANRQHWYDTVFFITFEALDTVSGRRVTYQTEVFYERGGVAVDVKFIRKKGQKKGQKSGILFHADLSDSKEYDMIKKGAELGISQCNEDMAAAGEPQIELVRIVKAARDTGTCPFWYIALQGKAMDSMSSQPTMYYAIMRFPSDVLTEMIQFVTEDDLNDEKYARAFDGLEEDEGLYS